MKMKHSSNNTTTTSLSTTINRSSKNESGELLLKFKSSDGTTYEGAYLNGERHGHGVARFPSGAVYDGCWAFGEPSGQGTLYSADGSTFVGLFEKGRRSGDGLVSAANGSVYEGSFSNGRRHGWGCMRYASGAVYEGDWMQGSRHGLGQQRYVDGAIYKGEFKHGLRSGEGVLTLTLPLTLTCGGGGGSLVYTGGFLRGRKHGRGVIEENTADIGVTTAEAPVVWVAANKKSETEPISCKSAGGVEGCDVDGNVDRRLTTTSGYCFDGSFEDDVKHGRCVERRRDGSVFHGYYYKGSKQGSKCRLQYANGAIYEGKFVCGVKIGKAIYRYACGDVYEGEFLQGKRHGMGEYKWVDGTVFYGRSFKGHFVSGELYSPHLDTSKWFEADFQLIRKPDAKGRRDEDEVDVAASKGVSPSPLTLSLPNVARAHGNKGDYDGDDNDAAARLRKVGDLDVQKLQSSAIAFAGDNKNGGYGFSAIDGAYGDDIYDDRSDDSGASDLLSDHPSDNTLHIDGPEVEGDRDVYTVKLKEGGVLKMKGIFNNGRITIE